MPQRHRKTGRVGVFVTVVAVVLILAGCGSNAPGSATPTTATPVSTTSVGVPSSAVPTRAATTTAPGTGSSVVILTDNDKGTTVDAHVGERLQVVLSSTYWSFQASSDRAVLRSDGPPQLTPEPSGCVPGEGCGTAAETFSAVGAGTATITATRTSCGEAMACTGDSGTYGVTVDVR